jgi:cellulose synthase/poly-beta-1,6-N-acetylglucosamine synthase-like glycosyltransferase
MLSGVTLLRYSAFELIVIYDPTDLATTECLLRHAPGARTGNCRTANLAKARNVGLSMARGDIVAFLDDDSVPEPDWLDRLAAAYTDPEVAAAGGFIRARNGVEFQYRVVLIDEFGTDYRRPQIPHRLPPGWFISLTGTNFSVRRTVALALGGFDEVYSYYLEETDFLLRLQRAGGRVCVVGSAEVHHGYAASDFRDENGVPKSLRGIARSKAYFCYINRLSKTPLTAVACALNSFVDKKRRHIRAHLRASRISPDDAARLLTELQTGILDGEVAAKKGRSIAPILALDDKKLEVYQPQHPPKARQRLCILVKTAPSNSSNWDVIRKLARLHYEVTVIYFGSSIRKRVIFSEGLWEHRLSSFCRLIFQFSHYAVLTEIQRVSASRRFEMIYVASDDPALEKASAASGLQRFIPYVDWTASAS